MMAGRLKKKWALILEIGLVINLQDLNTDTQDRDTKTAK